MRAARPDTSLARRARCYQSPRILLSPASVYDQTLVPQLFHPPGHMVDGDVESHANFLICPGRSYILEVMQNDRLFLAESWIDLFEVNLQGCALDHEGVSD